MPRQIGALRGWAEWTAVAPPWAILRALPLERAVRVGAAAGALAMTLDRGNRRIAMRNLEIAFPERGAAERLAILRDTYRNFGRIAAEWVHFFEFTPANIDRYVSYEGREHWEEAIRLSAGRGILVLTGHFGNFELLSVGHSVHGNRIAIVQRPNRNPIIDRAVAARRQHYGNLTISRKGAARDLMRLLRDDWMVAVPLDLDVRHGVFVDFFNLKASTSEALARLAVASRVPVLPAFMVREGATTRHRITILPVIETVRGGDRAANVIENTQHYTAAIEAMIRRHPDHWNWIHRRWKTRPAGEPRFY
ncbi:MAG TPA: lysophospholipid acyltransferase family protein [Candidatus Binataceae bacterium]|nr:lysophospholipid acyltransferase family protein [Candidatus Binataceae bacterium]HVC45232.1 lysophospholipid acyltransferase family protein [Candidatus Binataceae bacterium]